MASSSQSLVTAKKEFFEELVAQQAGQSGKGAAKGGKTRTEVLEEENEKLRHRIQKFEMAEHEMEELTKDETASNMSAWSGIGRDELAE